MPALWDALRVDVTDAARRVLRAPGLSAVVIGTLAVAIAANATIFSLLKPTVLAKLPVPEPDALVGIGAVDERTGNYSAFYVEGFRALQSGQQGLTPLAAFSSSIVRIDHAGMAFDTGVEGVTPEYFDVLGVRPSAGRLFVAADDPRSAIGVLSERVARRLFGNASAVGQRVLADGRAIEIIGVAGGGFTGVRMDGGDDLFLLLPFLRNTVLGSDPPGAPRAQQLIGRLAPGATLETVRAEVTGRWPGIHASVKATLPAAHQLAMTHQRLTVDSFARGFSGIRDRYGPSLTMVMGLAAAVLAVGCLNLSGLLLARALTRQHEFAVRIALGVGRWRLVQQVLIDGLLLSLAALVVALPLTWWASLMLTAMVSVGKAVPLDNTAPDATVLLAATAVSLAAGVLIGLLPAHRAVTRGLDGLWRGRGTAHRIRGSARVLLMGQVAASMVVVVGAGLFVTTLSNLYANDLRQDERPVLFTRLARQPLERSVVLGQPYFEALQERLARIPGAEAAAFSELYPAYLGFFGGMPTDTVTLGRAQAAAVSDHVSPGFFAVYAIAQLRGRDFTWADHDAAPKVAIVNQTLANQLSPDGDVVGRRMQIASGAATTDVDVIGVVADANVGSIRQRQVAGLYRPMMQELRRGQNPMAHVRVAGDLAAARHAYVGAVDALGQHLVRAIFTLDEWVDNAVLEQRLLAATASVAATLATGLASVGLFGLVAFSVSSRSRELGVRISLGATRADVVRMIVREALGVVLPGIAIGVPLALAGAWYVRSQLYGVSATDPRAVVIAALVLVVTAVLAAWLPALRASRIQPSEALRQE